MSSSLFVFIAFLLLFAFALFMVEAMNQRSFKKAFEYLRDSKVYLDWLRAGGIALVIVAGLSFAKSAQAAEPDVFAWTEVYFGVDYQAETPVCKFGGYGDSLAANAGVRQQLIGQELPVGRVDLIASYTHHSCALNDDRNTYDGIGTMIVWRVEW